MYHFQFTDTDNNQYFTLGKSFAVSGSDLLGAVITIYPGPTLKDGVEWQLGQNSKYDSVKVVLDGKVVFNKVIEKLTINTGPRLTGTLKVTPCRSTHEPGPY